MLGTRDLLGAKGGYRIDSGRASRGHITGHERDRVKPGGETGVRIDNYAEEPLALTKVARGTAHRRLDR